MDKDLALIIAAAILDKYDVGETSRFCDEPADFDRASSDDLATVIRPLLASTQPAAIHE
jgi:hypothetical protein